MLRLSDGHEDHRWRRRRRRLRQNRQQQQKEQPQQQQQQQQQHQQQSQHQDQRKLQTESKQRFGFPSPTPSPLLAAAAGLQPGGEAAQRHGRHVEGPKQGSSQPPLNQQKKVRNSTTESIQVIENSKDL